MPVIESSAGEATRLVIGLGRLYLTLQIEPDPKVGVGTIMTPMVLLNQRDALRLAVELIRRSAQLEDVKPVATRKKATTIKRSRKGKRA